MTGAAETRSLVDLAAALRTGSLEPGDYLAQLGDRFAEREAELRSFLPEDGRLERLLYETTRLEETHPDPATRPPLFGVPVGVKDIFHVDGFSTRAGSDVPPEELAGPEAEAVGRLRAAGALMLGKTVTTEFAYFSPGPTRNPVDFERTPGGSSSGSAAAVGAGLCPLALGTQTIGSIGRPASYCGIVGFKPSYGRIPLGGVIPLAPSLDHVGFFTRDVAGARLVAGLLCDDWRQDGAQAARPVLGVPEGTYLEHASSEALAGFESCIERLVEAGYVVRRASVFPEFAQIDDRHRLLVAAEAARVHVDWYARYGERYAPKTVELIERGLPVSDAQVEELRGGRQTLRSRLDGLLDAHGIDVWISPAAPGPAPRGLGSTGDPVMNLPWTHAGVPTVSLPAWEVDGLPMGLQIGGRFGADERLLAAAIGLEEALRR